MNKISGHKSAELDRLNGELEVARAELDSLRFKHEGALSRCDPWRARCVIQLELATVQHMQCHQVVVDMCSARWQAQDPGG